MEIDDTEFKLSEVKDILNRDNAGGNNKLTEQQRHEWINHQKQLKERIKRSHHKLQYFQRIDRAEL